MSEWPQWLSMPQIGCAAGLTLYIAGVTWFARSEARQSSQWGLAWGQFICNMAIGLLVWMVGQQSGAGSIRHSLMLMAVVAVSVNVRATAALLSPTPARVQLTVKSMLISYVLLDAALVYWQTGDPKLALLTVALVVPAMFLSRIIPMT